jgi:hypothetical protein
MLLEKNPHAVALGRRGGLVGGPLGGVARARVLSPERRREIARRAAEVRWGAAARPALPLPVAVARLLKTYDTARLRWEEPTDRWAIVSAVLVQGNAEARVWLDGRLAREELRALARQFRGAGLAEPERARLRAELDLDENEIPRRAFLGLGPGRGDGGGS